MRGRVVWATQRDYRIDKPVSMRVWVNGFQQATPLVATRMKDSLEREFEVPILLNRSRKNEIEVELPDWEEAADNQQNLNVDCRKPNRSQRLHVLLVGVETSPKELEQDRLMTALQASSIRGNRFKTPAFDSCRIYGPLTGYVSPGQIITQLVRIRTAIRVTSARERANDVILVYYQGGETVEKDGRYYLLTSASQHDRDLSRSAISSFDLESLLRKAPGAHVVLLDLQQAGTPARVAGRSLSPWPSESRVGMFRSSWLSPQSAPAETRLLSLFPGSLRESPRLGQVASDLASKYRKITAKYPETIAFGAHVPSPLADLMLTQPAQPE